MEIFDNTGNLLHNGYKLTLPDYTTIIGGTLSNINEDFDQPKPAHDSHIQICITWDLPEPIHISGAWIYTILRTNNAWRVEIWGKCDRTCNKRTHYNCGSHRARYTLQADLTRVIIHDAHQITVYCHIPHDILLGG